MQETGFEFEDSFLQNNVLLRMNTIRKEGHFCDAVLLIQGKSIAVHKVVLAASSVYFFELFSKSSADPPDKARFSLDDTPMDFSSLQLVVNYFYTSKLQCSYESVRQVYKCGHHLKLASLVDHCFQYLHACLTPHNCLSTYAAVSKIEIKQHLDNVQTFMQAHMDSILESSLEFSQLPCILVDIVGTTSFDFSVTEVPLCKLVAQWLQTETIETPVEDMLDKKYMLYLTPENILVDCVDVRVKEVQCDVIEDYKKLCGRKQNHDKNHLSTKTDGNSSRASQADDRSSSLKKTAPDLKYGLVATTIVAENSFMSIMQLKKTLVSVSIKFKSDESLSRRLSTSSSASIASNNHSEAGFMDDFGLEMRRSQCLVTELAPMSVARCGFAIGLIEERIFVAGGYGRTDCLGSVESYSLQGNYWSPCKPMASVRGRVSAGVLRGELVVCGGSNGSNELSSVEAFNPETNTWRHLPDMLVARSNAGVVVCGDKLYVIGGLAGSKTLSNCEVFDPQLNKWSSIADLKTGKSQAAVCVFRAAKSSSLSRSDQEDRIAVLGGSNSWNCMGACDSYTPSNDSWQALPPLSVARRGAGAAFFKGMLYVVGGSDGQTTLNSVEVLDLGVGHWTFSGNLCALRANMGAVVMQGKFFLVGGFGGKSFLKSQEFLDAESEEWSSFLQNNNGEKFLEDALLPSSSQHTDLPSSSSSPQDTDQPTGDHKPPIDLSEAGIDVFSDAGVIRVDVDSAVIQVQDFSDTTPSEQPSNLDSNA